MVSFLGSLRCAHHTLIPYQPLPKESEINCQSQPLLCRLTHPLPENCAIQILTCHLSGTGRVLRQGTTENKLQPLTFITQIQDKPDYCNGSKVHSLLPHYLARSSLGSVKVKVQLTPLLTKLTSLPRPCTIGLQRKNPDVGNDPQTGLQMMGGGGEWGGTQANTSRF